MIARTRRNKYREIYVSKTSLLVVWNDRKRKCRDIQHVRIIRIHGIMACWLIDREIRKSRFYYSSISVLSLSRDLTLFILSCIFYEFNIPKVPTRELLYSYIHMYVYINNVLFQFFLTSLNLDSFKRNKKTQRRIFFFNFSLHFDKGFADYEVRYNESR